MFYGLQVDTVATLVTVWTLATAALILRLAARRMTRMPLWLDDFACLAAYLLGAAYNAWEIVWIRDGCGLRLEDITWLSRAEALTRTRQALYFGQAFNSLSLGTSKLAILSLYWRLFSHSRIRYAIMYLGFLSFCWLVARTTVGLIRCIPAVSFWDSSVPGECFVDERKMLYGGSISHLMLDILILILPLFELRKLRLNFWPKLGVIFMFMSGILVCLSAVGVIVAVLRMPSDEEISFNIRYAVIFATIEVNFSIVTSCLPLLRPIFEFLHRHVHLPIWPCCSCIRAGVFPPAPSSRAPSERQQSPRQRHRRLYCPTSLPTTLTTLFGSSIWSRLSSATTSKVSTRIVDDKSRTVGNKTVMTVVHGEGSTHVHLRREFRFVSPPGPEPYHISPRGADSSIEPGAVSIDDDAPFADESNAVDRMEKGEGKAIHEVGRVGHPKVERMALVGASTADQFEKDKGNEKFDGPTRPKSVGVTKDGSQIVAESEDEPKAASAASIIKESGNNAQRVEK